MNEMIDISKGTEEIGENTGLDFIQWSEGILPEKIKNKRFVKELNLSYFKTDSKILTFENCIFENIQIKNLQKELLEKIVFKGCRINQLKLYKYRIDLILEEVSLQMLELKECEIPLLQIDHSEVDATFFKSNSLINEMHIVNKSTVGVMDYKDAGSDIILLHDSTVEKLCIREKIQHLEIKEGAVLERLYFDNKDDLTMFFKNLKKERKQLGKVSSTRKILELKHQQQIIRAAFDLYSDENKYQEQDICLIEYRKISCALNRMTNKNPVKKLRYILEDIVLGVMFGWGVKVFNSLITSAVIIFLFGIWYFGILVKSADSALQCFFISMYHSINRFFGTNDMLQMTIIPYFDTLEQIMGVIILTIFTGVIARKIIR